MSHKLRPRLGSAIASTILSLAALSVAGVDQVQAAVLTFNFQVEEGGGGGFFKLSNSSLTGIGSESIAVGEGRFNTFAKASAASDGLKGKDYYDLAGAIALFYQGDLVGLEASGSDYATREIRFPDEPEGSFYLKYDGRALWEIGSGGRRPDNTWTSYFWGYRETIVSDREGPFIIIDRRVLNGANVSYTLVDTEAEPVPEPLTAGTAAVALAGLSWLKHQKKMAG